MNKLRGMRPLKIVGIAVAGLVAFAVALVAFGWVTLHLWNWLMPAIFGLRTITFVQALGLLLLSHILFGGFHGHGRGRRRWRGRMEERWEKMTPEERERLRAGMRGRWGCGFGGDAGPAPEQKPL